MMGTNLRPVHYRKENRGEILSEKCHFPSLPMLEWSVIGDEDVEIIAVMTDDDNKNTEGNLCLFEEELKQVSAALGRDLRIDRKIVLPHREDREKQVELFKTVCGAFEEGAQIYMDITYGTKVTAVGLFSALTYAEKVKHCDIRSIYYGKFSFGSADIGDIYDVRSLYELTALIHTADFLGTERLSSLIDELWGCAYGHSSCV